MNRCPKCGSIWEPCSLCRAGERHQQCVNDDMCHECIMDANPNGRISKLFERNYNMYTIEIKSHKWVEYGRNNSATYFPFINGKPIHSIANCEYCKLNSTNENDVCLGWKNDLDSTPLFCGPICDKFDLVESKRKLLNELFTEDEG